MPRNPSEKWPELGEKITKAIQSSRYKGNVAKLSADSGIAATTIGTWKKGIIFGVDGLYQLCKTLNISADQLLGLNPQKPIARDRIKDLAEKIIAEVSEDGDEKKDHRKNLTQYIK